MPVISVSLPSEDLDAFDDLVEHMGYESRSSAVRDALYRFVQDHRLELEDEGHVELVLTLVYAADRGQGEVQDVIHEHQGLVRSALHEHLDGRCVDLLVLRGDAPAVHEVVDELSRIRDVRVRASTL